MKRSEREENIKDEEKKKKTKKIGLDRAAARRGRRSLVPKEKIKSPARSGLTASDPPSSKGLTSLIASLRIISRDSPVFFFFFFFLKNAASFT
jgi:hypothetical protein